ncbi:hypothetical protein [Methylotenera sp.]|uniref:hypothetical protein n=1 Tax=Methylotenera sp. TaxID=2051956 RepID=UPI002EDAE55C
MATKKKAAAKKSTPLSRLSKALDGVAKGHKGAKGKALKAAKAYANASCKLKTTVSKKKAVTKIGKKKSAARKRKK